MKIRESGMPEEAYWESFFDVQNIFKNLQLDNKINDIVEFGSGYGTFTTPAAKIIRGEIHAFDIDEMMINRLKQRILEEKLSNVKIYQTDFVKGGTKLTDKSVDYAMLFNILHAEKPQDILNETFRILRNGGKTGIIHWRYDPSTPRGPSMEIRPKPEDLKNMLVNSGFNILRFNINLPPYHYGILAQKI